MAKHASPKWQKLTVDSFFKPSDEKSTQFDVKPSVYAMNQQTDMGIFDNLIVSLSSESTDIEYYACNFRSYFERILKTNPKAILDLLEESAAMWERVLEQRQCDQKRLVALRQRICIFGLDSPSRVLEPDWVFPAEFQFPK
jgi:hypothetical protein